MILEFSLFVLVVLACFGYSVAREIEKTGSRSGCSLVLCFFFRWK